MNGFQVLFTDQTVSTVWSAPNYCYRFGNLASVMEIDDHGNRNFNVFEQAPPPTTSAFSAAASSAGVKTSNYFL
jgi:serine/threonine-protein phosphatase PPG1